MTWLAPLPFAIEAANPGSGAGPDLSVLGNYGVVGLLAALGLWFAYQTWKREVKRADELDAEVKRLNVLIQEKVIPALVAGTSATSESTALIRDLTSGGRSISRESGR